MDDGMLDKAKEVGRLLGQTAEYKELQRARQRLNEDRETVELVNRLAELERDLTVMLQQGETPDEESRRAYEDTFSRLQEGPRYQALVAAQSNFDRVLQQVNERIGAGMEAGSKSSIILSS
ncbi:MAG TPA: YlbF family regulator [Longimicrobiales bacterium]|nr:YlbF family regulator [Longimicrobiales bacterium]